MAERDEPASTQHRNATPSDYEHALEGVDFPASLDAIMHVAEDKGGLDNEVHRILEELPERTYESMDDLGREIEAAYERTGGSAAGTPAAKPETTPRAPRANTRKS